MRQWLCRRTGFLVQSYEAPSQTNAKKKASNQAIPKIRDLRLRIVQIGDDDKHEQESDDTADQVLELGVEVAHSVPLPL